MTVFIAQASSPSLWPTLPILCLSVLVAVTAHIFNAIPDIDSDRQLNLGGLAVSLGKTKSIVVARVLMTLAVACLAWVVADIVSHP
jgi:4-hydroxybenzoate polyprenyltransferase